MTKKSIGVLLLLLVSLLPQAWAQTDSGAEEGEEKLQVRVKGFLDSYHAVCSEGKAEWMASRTRARGEVTVEKGDAGLFLSLNATYNALLRDRTGVELREAYLSYTTENLDLRIGRQIVVWGVADGLRITDCVSPFDYTEFLARDYDDIRMPVNALRAQYTLGSVTLEGICTPIPELCILPTDPNNPWAIHLPGWTDSEKNRPARTLKNMEYGGRIKASLQGVDFSLALLRTWNKMPAFEIGLAEDGLSLITIGQYRRMTMLGADCALPIGELVLRGEVAYNIGEAQSVRVGHKGERRNTLNTLVGVDWYAGNDWNISVQYSHKVTPNPGDGLSAYRHAGLATARISKELLQNTLKLSTFAYVDLADGGLFNRFAATYSLTDQVALSAGYDYLSGNKGLFAQYRHNDEAWIKLKYSF